MADTTIEHERSNCLDRLPAAASRQQAGTGGRRSGSSIEPDVNVGPSIGYAVNGP